MGAPGQARNKRVTQGSQEWVLLEVGAADKDALKVRLGGDRIFAAEPVDGGALIGKSAR